MKTATTKGGIIAAQRNKPAETAKVQQNVATMMNTMLDKEGFRKRFDELLGKRAPQFIASLVALMNADESLKQVFYEAPVTIIQAALKAAAYDLPIDPGLGYAYIVPFNNKKKDGTYAHEAMFILGYKGMNQLALRSGAYKRINVIDVRDGELKAYNRLTEEIELDFIDDEEVREQTPVIGYCGYFQLVNGMEKTIYMTKKQIDQHEQKFRKGKFLPKTWRENYDSMACKTVFRRLIGKWGIMSVNYQVAADPATMAAATALASGQLDDEDQAFRVRQTIDMDTGEVLADTQTPTAQEQADDALLDDCIKPMNP